MNKLTLWIGCIVVVIVAVVFRGASYNPLPFLFSSVSETMGSFGGDYRQNMLARYGIFNTAANPATNPLIPAGDMAVRYANPAPLPIIPSQITNSVLYQSMTSRAPAAEGGSRASLSGYNCRRKNDIDDGDDGFVSRTGFTIQINGSCVMANGLFPYNEATCRRSTATVTDGCDVYQDTVCKITPDDGRPYPPRGNVCRGATSEYACAQFSNYLRRNYPPFSCAFNSPSLACLPLYGGPSERTCRSFPLGSCSRTQSVPCVPG